MNNNNAKPIIRVIQTWMRKLNLMKINLFILRIKN